MIATLSCSGRERRRLRVRAYAGVDEPMVKALGLLGRVEADRVLARAGRAEIVGAAADRDHERVVRNLAARDQLLAVSSSSVGAIFTTRRARSRPSMRPSWNSKWCQRACAR